MSYRSFKHLLGETSLERKCRFIFGLGILVLVSSSFFWYGQKTESLVMKQTTQTARMLVRGAIKDKHIKALGNADFEPIFQVLSDDLKPVEDLPNYEVYVLNPYLRKGEKTQPLSDFEADVLTRFVKAANAEDTAPKPGASAAILTLSPTELPCGPNRSRPTRRNSSTSRRFGSRPTIA